MAVLPSVPLQRFESEVMQKNGIEFYLLREDLNHPLVGGNKWRKLRLNFQQAKENGSKLLLSMGGAFSNHLYALAALAKEENFPCKFFVREVEDLENPTLKFIREQGAEIEFVSRTAFRELRGTEGQEKRCAAHPESYFIPEGGSNSLAYQGCLDIGKFIPENTDLVAVPVGTGCTIAGIIDSVPSRVRVLGFSIMKENFLEKNVAGFREIENEVRWMIDRNYHLGGIGKYTQAYLDFLNEFYRSQKIALDPIYNGKMIYGLFQQIENQHFVAGTRIVAVLTGGQQGIAGFKYRHGKVLEY